MARILFHAMPATHAEAIWAGGMDFYGLLPETMVSNGLGFTCRHCLGNVDEGEKLVVFAYPVPSRGRLR